MRGFIYSISVALLFASILGFVYFYSFQASAAQYAADEPLTVLQGAKLVRSLESDFDRALLISGKSAVLAASERVLTGGVSLGDARTSLSQFLVDGKLGTDNSTDPAMGNNYLSMWAASMQNLTGRYGYNVTLTVSSASTTISMVDPYHVQFTTNLTVRISPLHTMGEFNLTRTSVHTTAVSLAGYEDPVYAVGGSGLVPRRFYPNVTAVYGVSALDDAITNKYYLPSSAGPDFLNRLEGKFTASAQGLETLVDVNELLAQDLRVYNRSMVDWNYFNNSVVEGNVSSVNGSSHPLFLTDCALAARYGVAANVTGC